VNHGAGRSVIEVGGVRTRIVRLNIITSHNVNIGANQIIIHATNTADQQPDQSIWHQPVWTTSTNAHGTITASGQTAANLAPHGAFNGWIGDVTPGRRAGFDSPQWTKPGSTGWLQLTLNYYIVVNRIVFYQRFSTGSCRTRYAYFTGTNGVPLGESFIGVNRGGTRSVVEVGGIRTRIIRLHIISSHNVNIGANQINIEATTTSNQISDTNTWHQPRWTSKPTNTAQSLQVVTHLAATHGELLTVG